MALTGIGENFGISDTSSKTTRVVPTIASNTTASDSLSLQITSHKFNGRNFFQWSTSVQMVIQGRGKLGYINGSKPKPSETDPSFQTWDAKNSIVTAWIINSMREDISHNFMLYPTTKSM